MKRSQGEIFGIALLFVIIIVGFLIYVQFNALNPNRGVDTFTESQYTILAEGTLNSLLAMSTGCFVERGRDSVRDLINYCVELGFPGNNDPEFTCDIASVESITLSSRQSLGSNSPRPAGTAPIHYLFTDYNEDPVFGGLAGGSIDYWKENNCIGSNLIPEDYIYITWPDGIHLRGDPRARNLKSFDPAPFYSSGIYETHPQNSLQCYTNWCSDQNVQTLMSTTSSGSGAGLTYLPDCNYNSLPMRYVISDYYFPSSQRYNEARSAYENSRTLSLQNQQNVMVGNLRLFIYPNQYNQQETENYNQGLLDYESDLARINLQQNTLPIQTVEVERTRTTINSCSYVLDLLDRSLNATLSNQVVGYIPYELKINLPANDRSLLHDVTITNFGEYIHRDGSIVNQNNYLSKGYRRAPSGLRTWSTAQRDIRLELYLYYR